ncbi:hypothetical protein OH77DRAFT_1429774 [Trametes cingulata]|nr:hypothetical protein OH77DRAFT_1429774 [Trametes cingulata]
MRRVRLSSSTFSFLSFSFLSLSASLGRRWRWRSRASLDLWFLLLREDARTRHSTLPRAFSAPPTAASVHSGGLAFPCPSMPPNFACTTTSASPSSVGAPYRCASATVSGRARHCSGPSAAGPASAVYAVAL